MRYFNGFSLQGEASYFEEYLVKGDLVVSGFSYGAQQALEYVYHSSERVDRLILLSPAFFQTQKPSFVRTQLRYFQSGQEAYVENFLGNVSSPSSVNLSEHLKVGTTEELEALLTYRWDMEKIKTLVKKGTVIEVFLGSEDKIIDSHAAFEFFKDITTTYFIKNVGHLLH